jgi:hypothetical protein
METRWYEGISNLRFEISKLNRSRLEGTQRMQKYGEIDIVGDDVRRLKMMRLDRSESPYVGSYNI